MLCWGWKKQVNSLPLSQILPTDIDKQKRKDGEKEKDRIMEKFNFDSDTLYNFPQTVQ